MARATFTMVENPVPWPNGARCAAAFTWDVDADSILHLAHPDTADNRIMAMSDLRFGPEVAIPRICRMFEAYGMKLTFFVPAWCIEEHPKAIERMLQGGHEIAHHGFMHELPNQFTPERERYWTERSYDIIKRVTGQPPRGYRSPWVASSKYTTAILADLGFLYDSSLMGDDVPYIIEDKAGRQIVELPLQAAMDDWPHYMHSGALDYMMAIETPRRAKESFLSEFDAAWNYNTYWQATWHCFLSGRLPRMHAISEIIEYIQDKGDVWFATLEEIALHVKTLVERGEYAPRIHRLPIKDGRVADIPDPMRER